MKVICASHPTLDAIARCVTCGIHLCEGCRTRLGVQNFCRSCREHLKLRTVPSKPATPPPATKACFKSRCKAPAMKAAAEKPAKKLSGRSPFLASALSVIPGLGQLYTGRFLRGLIFFCGGLALHESGAPALLALFLYVFNLWDAYRLAALRNRSIDPEPVSDKELKRDRFDDGLFTLTGLGVLAYTFLEMGGLNGNVAEHLVPLAGVAVALLVAQETRDPGIAK